VADELFLPNASEAVVPVAKLRDYVLSPEHARGKHKARVFQSALGIGQGDWEYLRDQVLEGVRRFPVVSLSAAHPFGTIYSVAMPIEGLNGATHQVITAWIVEGEAPPRLTTLYVDIP
jgi:filamentous hemagglutinin